MVAATGAAGRRLVLDWPGARPVVGTSPRAKHETLMPWLSGVCVYVSTAKPGARRSGWADSTGQRTGGRGGREARQASGRKVA